MSDAQPPEDELEPEDEEHEELDKSPRSSAKLPPAPSPRGGRQALESKQRSTAAASEEELPYIDDPVSKIWVAAIVGVFALILAYGLLFGKGGALSPATPSPEPTAVPSPTVSASPSPTVSATPTPSSSASFTPAPSGSTTPAPTVTITPAPSTTPSAPPTAAPSASPTPAPASPTPAPASPTPAASST